VAGLRSTEISPSGAVTAQDRPPFRATAAILVLAIATPLCLAFGDRGFAPVLAAAGLLTLGLSSPPRAYRPGLLMLVGLVGWATITTFWSPAQNVRAYGAYKDVQRLTQMHLALQLLLGGSFVIYAATLKDEIAQRFLHVVSIGVLVGISFLYVEMHSQGKIYQVAQVVVHETVRPDIAIRNLAQGGFVLAILAWPLGASLYMRGWKVAALATFAFVPLSTIFFRGFASTVGLALSIPVFLLILKFGRPVIRAMAIVVIFYFVATPWLFLLLPRGDEIAVFGHSLPPSWNARLEIWEFVSHKLIEHPILGWGLDASRTFPGVVPLHPHDVPLQLWFELGVPGVVLGGGFWAWLCWRIGELAQRDRRAGALCAAVMTTYLAISAVGFGLWQEWWICVGALGVATCLMTAKSLALDSRNSPFSSAP
jgi:O-antigen ligase